MDWGGNFPEFSRAPSRTENYPIVERHNKKKGRGEESPELGGLFSSPFFAGVWAHDPLKSR